jgi:dTDP-4-amino-4,6-dideoxygalactose transaminase
MTTQRPTHVIRTRAARAGAAARAAAATRAATAAPFLPFTRPSIDEETIAGVAEVLRSGWLTSGPRVEAIEAALSALFGGRPVRAFNSGTCTMEVALRIAGIGPGDEVITTPLSWVATSNVILAVGARPVFVDIDPVTRNIDLALADRAVTPRTRAIIPVDLAGLPVDRDRLYQIAARHRLRVIEDAAQSIGANWRGRPVGSTGDFVSFSFHPNKNITTIEGGALVLNDGREAALAAQYRLQGVVRPAAAAAATTAAGAAGTATAAAAANPDAMDVIVRGGKYNLTDVAARVGLGQLPRLGEVTRRRRELARHYLDLLGAPGMGDLGLGLPPADFTQSNWHMFQVLLPEKPAVPRAAVMRRMHEAGIGTGAHYPAIHLFTLYRGLGWKPGDFPRAERAGRDLLTLPLFPAMTGGDVERVVRELARVIRANLKP